MRDDRRIPAIAQMKPCGVKIQIRIVATLTPASREASGLPPIASVFLPKMVRFSTKPNRMNRITMIQMGVGMPRKVESAS